MARSKDKKRNFSGFEYEFLKKNHELNSGKPKVLKSLKRTISTGENVTVQNTFDKYFGNRAYGDGTRGKGPGSAHS